MASGWKNLQSGFTLIEIAIVLLIVTILLGYTVALFPIQQELKQYRAVDGEMQEIVDALVAHAQVNGRLPCADGDNDGLEDWSVATSSCSSFLGNVPAKSIGFEGSYAGGVLVDPWGTPYTYQVAFFDTGADSHFTIPNGMRNQGIDNLVPTAPDATLNSTHPEYLQVCDVHPAGQTSAAVQADRDCDPTTTRVVSNLAAVVVSHGKDRQTVVSDTSNIQSENLDNGMTDTVFVSAPRSDADGDEFDDVVKWISLNHLFSAMIEADRLP